MDVENQILQLQSCLIKYFTEITKLMILPHAEKRGRCYDAEVCAASTPELTLLHCTKLGYDFPTGIQLAVDEVS